MSASADLSFALNMQLPADLDAVSQAPCGFGFAAIRDISIILEL